MRFLKNALALSLGIAVASGLVACDSGEDNLDFEVGSTLTVVGPSSVTIRPTVKATVDTTVANGDTTIAVRAGSVTVTPGRVENGYYVQAFTLNRDYAWAYNGATVSTACSGSNFPCLRVRSPADNSYTGEYLDALFTTRGDYTVAVSSGQYKGSMMVKATEPPVLSTCIASKPTVAPGAPITISGILAGSGPAATVSVAAPNGTPATATSLPVTVTYATAGNYTVTVTAKNTDGTATCTVSVKVRARRVAA